MYGSWSPCLPPMFPPHPESERSPRRLGRTREQPPATSQRPPLTACPLSRRASQIRKGRGIRSRRAAPRGWFHALGSCLALLFLSGLGPPFLSFGAGSRSAPGKAHFSRMSIRRVPSLATKEAGRNTGANADGQLRSGAPPLQPIRQLGKMAGGLVGPGRFELPTSPLSGARSNQLSYGPVGMRKYTVRGDYASAHSRASRLRRYDTTL